MPTGAFDIYQTDAGYAAVTNPVQRQILDSLRGGERQLAELMVTTGRSKPTLSSLHMKELLERRLIEERPHPTDNRRKVYRLRGTKIGSSDLPVTALKSAIQDYVNLSPFANRLPVAASVDAILAAPSGTPLEVLRLQAVALGVHVGTLLKLGNARDLWMRIAGFLETERLAIPVRIDVQAGTLELRPEGALAANPERAAVVVAGLLEGVAKAKAIAMRQVVATAENGHLHLSIKT
jgi:DNA-binding HxlR family transcriptional regulator